MYGVLTKNVEPQANPKKTSGKKIEGHATK